MSQYAKYIEEWAKSLNVDGLWGVIEHLVKINNFDTAAAVMFDLSWKHHKEYLRKCSDTLKEFKQQYPDADFNRDYLYQWACAYNEEFPSP